MVNSTITPPETGIPASFKPLLWSYDFSKIDPEKNKKAVVVNAINYGNLSHWAWLVHHYGKDNVRSFLEQIPATALRPRARELAALIFSINQWNHASRSTN